MYLTTQICRADSIYGVDLPPPSDPKSVVLWSSREPGWGDRRGVSLIFEGISWRYPLSFLYHTPILVFLINPQFQRLLLDLLRREAVAMQESLLYLIGLVMVLCYEILNSFI